MEVHRDVLSPAVLYEHMHAYDVYQLPSRLHSLCVFSVAWLELLSHCACFISLDAVAPVTLFACQWLDISQQLPWQCAAFLGLIVRGHHLSVVMFRQAVVCLDPAGAAVF